MKTNRYIQIIAAGLTAAALPLTAAAQVTEVELQPGFYDYTQSMSMAGFSQGTESFQYCIEDGKNSWDLMGLFAQNALADKCTLSNVQMTATKGSANSSCRVEEIGLVVTAKIDATYTKTSFDAIMTTKFPNMPDSVSEISASRSGTCPAGWTNPVYEDEDEE